MITKNQIKYVRGLSLKKNRVKEQCFIVEGEKCVAELIDSDFEIVELFALKDWMNQNKDVFQKVKVVSLKELQRISNLSSPNKVLAVVKARREKNIEEVSGLVLVLDQISDPGNLGTIIRMCDWFGVQQIICSRNTVDIYNSKVVQSAMGSLFRVSVIYTDLSRYLADVKTPVYGAYMSGEDAKGIVNHNNIHLVMGNEANGISKKLERYINKRVSIRNMGDNIDSLNVSVAAVSYTHLTLPTKA